MGAKNQKIKNPRQSLDKESIERDDFFDRITKSPIAAEKELLEDRPPSKNLYPSSLKGLKHKLLMASPILDSADSLLAPNHQNPGTELDFSNSTKVACLVQ